MKLRETVLPALTLLASLAQAAVIGINQPAPPLTQERLAELAPEQRQAWAQYLAKSRAQREADIAVLAAERAALKAAGEPIPAGPAGGNAEKTMPLNQAAAWYGSAEALRVADNIVSFQTPAGGWGKNQPRAGAARLRGQDFVANNNAKTSVAGDFDKAEEASWSYVGTIDNDATITEIRFLAKVAAQHGDATAAALYRRSALKGLQYLLAAQFPNGGWPQVWPLQGGYHNALTLNDNAMVQVATLMGAAARGEQEFAFLSDAQRALAGASERQAIASLLAAQISIKGRQTLWAQQYDALTLAPTTARNYEPAALSSSESAAVLMYLMALPAPPPAVIQAVSSGVQQLRELAIDGYAWRQVGNAEGRRLVAEPGAGPLWARYYALDSLKPIFGDRDKSLHDDVNEISLERRNGYAWFSTSPAKVLEAYARWPHRIAAPR
jgi:PelA/Pel-15E family pectate lyase